MLYISQLLYPKCSPWGFVIYMYFKYHSVLRRHTKYAVETLSDNVLWNFVNNCPKSNCDINNCVLVHPDNIYPSDRVLLLYHQDSGTFRRVVAVPDSQCRRNILCVSNTFFYNHFRLLTKEAVQAKLIKPSVKAKFAQEIELVLITCDFNISNAFIDKAIRGYFTLPKLIKKDDVVSVNIKHFSEECFYGNLKPSSMETLHFKCSKILLEGTETEEEQFCVIGETAIKQGPNIQGFIPKTSFIGSREVLKGTKSLSEVAICPNGLQLYMENLNRAVSPFLQSSKQSV